MQHKHCTALHSGSFNSLVPIFSRPLPAESERGASNADGEKRVTTQAPKKKNCHCQQNWNEAPVLAFAQNQPGHATHEREAKEEKKASSNQNGRAQTLMWQSHAASHQCKQPRQTGPGFLLSPSVVRWVSQASQGSKLKSIYFFLMGEEKAQKYLQWAGTANVPKQPETTNPIGD